jgi:hypothetical protein
LLKNKGIVILIILRNIENHRLEECQTAVCLGDKYDGAHTILRHVAYCERLPFLLFGASHISFWYEQLFKGRAVSKYTKDFINIGLGHKARTEVLFASMPWDHAQPLA